LKPFIVVPSSPGSGNTTLKTRMFYELYEFQDWREPLPREERTTQNVLKGVCLKAKARILPWQGQHLALPVLHVPHSLDSGLEIRHLEAGVGGGREREARAPREGRAPQPWSAPERNMNTLNVLKDSYLKAKAII
jgi:hypothetical protein